MNIKYMLITITLLCCSVSGFAQQLLPMSQICYRSETDEYMQSQCLLDIYLPEDVENFATVVWFHAGGLTTGSREIPEPLKGNGFAVVGVGYRLAPEVSTLDCIDDAAASIAWVFNNIEKYGGDSSKIYLSGHSAGGYLVSIVGLDKKWLSAYGVDVDSVAGLIPYSGHAITHFETRHERGIKPTTAVVDTLAPLYHVRPDAPPILLITGDREMELYGRYEECAYFWRMLTLAGHPNCELYELEGFDHGAMAQPAHMLLIKYINSRDTH